MSATALLSLLGLVACLLLAAGLSARPGKRWLRRHWVQHVRRGLRSRQSPWPGIDPAAATLIFAPHPDDDTLGCAGLIARRTAAGSPVFIAFITDGSASHPHHPAISPRQLAVMRAGEARIASALLGVPGDRLAFFNAPDGKLPDLSAADRQALTAGAADLIQRIQPREIFVTAAADGSTEHAAANALVRAAAAKLTGTKLRILEYPVWSRWNPRLLPAAARDARHVYHLMLTPAEAALKADAIDCHRSQVEPLPPCTQPLLSAEFLGYFRDDEEFFFEF